MKKKTMILFLTVMMVGIAGSVYPSRENGWVRDKTKNGVEQYYRHVEGSPIKEYKAACNMEFPMEVLLEVLIDVPSYPEWMPDCMKAEIIKEFKKGHEQGNYYIHMIWDGIWPARNRDLVIESIPRTDWDKGVSHIYLRKLYDYPIPEQEGVVRVREFVSEFVLEYISREKTRVTFSTYVDVGGIVPPDIAAIQTANVAYNTLMGLQNVAADPRYFKAAARDYF